ncbi:MAG: RNA polymerase sigma factor [Gemmataceae bacterium]
MSRPASSVAAQPTADVEPARSAPPPDLASANGPPAVASGELLVRTFNEARDELVSTLWFLLGNADDAQDIAQEVFLRCWRGREGLPEVHNLRAWIFRVGLNAAKDLQRSAWRRRARPLLGGETMPQPHAASVAHDLEERESLERLRQALTHLRAEEQEVFLLRQNGDLTYEQIAELHGRPVGTVKTQMRSALAKLRKVLT